MIILYIVVLINIYCYIISSITLILHIHNILYYVNSIFGIYEHIKWFSTLKESKSISKIIKYLFFSPYYSHTNHYFRVVFEILIMCRVSIEYILYIGSFIRLSSHLMTSTTLIHKQFPTYYDINIRQVS